MDNRKRLNKEDRKDNRQSGKLKTYFLTINKPNGGQQKEHFPKEAVKRPKVKHSDLHAAGWFLTLLSLVGVVRPKDGRADEGGSGVGEPVGGAHCKVKDLPQSGQKFDNTKKVKTKRMKRDQVETITERDRGPKSNSLLTAGPSTSTGVQHVQSGGNVQSQTARAPDLHAVKLDSFNAIFISFLEELTAEQLKLLRGCSMDPVMKTLLAEMLSESAQFVSEAVLEVIMPAVVKTHGPVPPVSTKTRRSDVKVCKIGQNNSSTPSLSSSSNGSQTGVPRTLGDGGFKSSEPLRDLFGITEEILLSDIKDPFRVLISKFLRVQREVQLDTQTLFRVIVEDVSKKVNSMISDAIQTPRFTGLQGPVIFSSGGVSNTKVIEEMVSGASVALQMFVNGQNIGEQNIVFDDVEADISNLTGQLMTALSETALSCGDKEREKAYSEKADLLDVVWDNIKELVTGNSWEGKLRYGQAHHSGHGAKWNISLSTQSMDRLLTQEFQTKATDTIRNVTRRFFYYSSCCSVVPSTMSIHYMSEMGNLWERNSAIMDPDATELLNTFVSKMTSLTQSIRSSSSPAEREQILLENHQCKIWSCTVDCYNSMKSTLKRIFVCPKEEILGTFVEPTAGSSTLVATLRPGLASQMLTQNHVLFDTAKEIVNQVLALSNGGSNSEMSLAANGFVDAILADLNGSTDLDASASEQCLSEFTTPSVSLCFDKLCTEEFQTKASHVVSGILHSGLINFVNTGLDVRREEILNRTCIYGHDTDVKRLQKTESLSTPLLHTKAVASEIVKTMAKDVDSFTQMIQVSGSAVSGKFEKSLSASGHDRVSIKGKPCPYTFMLFNSVFNKVKDFFVQQQRVLLANVAEAAIHHISTPIDMSGTEQQTSQTNMESYCKAFVSQTLMSIQDRMTKSERVKTAEGLVTCSIVNSMLEELDGMSEDGNVGLGTHRATSKYLRSITSSKSRASQVDDFRNPLPGTPIPDEWPVESNFPIIRSSVIDMCPHLIPKCHQRSQAKPSLAK